MNLESVIEIANECGFETAAPMKVETIKVMSEVRDMCAANTCRAYGKSWSCPPACGTIEECEARIQLFEQGILVQSVGELEDSWDYEGIQELEKLHKKRFFALVDKLSEELDEMLPLAAGCCTLCKECAYPEPCRIPKKLISSMEAYGLLVNQICTENGVAYNYGPNKMAYSSCVLFGKK